MVAIFSSGMPAGFRRTDLPVSIRLRPKQGGKASVGGEIRPTKPIDGSIAIDQGSGLAIANESIIFNSCSHMTV
jgi:hypothetical protein